ncbi:MAG: hypothetical protein M1822_008239 [Bathelium mastoideum]|nr:MAG: hypothetical protein M1822_008239 [Bathelium mastoideum]
MASIMLDSEPSDTWLSEKNTITWQGEARAVPDDYFIYASVSPDYRSSAKRSWVGDEMKYGSNKRWMPPSKIGNTPEYKPREDVLSLDKLDVQAANDEEIVLTGNRNSLLLRMGDPTDCALFAQDVQRYMRTTFDDIVWALESGAFDPDKLVKFLSSYQGRPRLTYRESDWKKQQLARRALATISEIYGQFPMATVALKVIEIPLFQHKWLHKWSEFRVGSNRQPDSPLNDLDESISDHDSLEEEPGNSDQYADTVELERSDLDLIGFSSFELSRAEAFALLTTFETGFLNPDPWTLSKVMAISSGDSIFVATQLLADPTDSLTLRASSVCRIRGNIGKPGVVMLVPPPELQVKSRNSADWKLINHTPFNGQLMDSFRGTSLHLALTEYSRALDTGTHGVRDADIYYREAYVQVFFKGQWIGDMDILSSIQSSYIKGFHPQETSSCTHSAVDIRTFPIVSIDNWDEFLDNPKDGIIVRANNNWMARLAATSLSAQRKDNVVLIKNSDRICWPCIANRFKLRSSARNYVFIC